MYEIKSIQGDLSMLKIRSKPKKKKKKGEERVGKNGTTCERCGCVGVGVREDLE